jgi:RnfABCDGE-type electron transport complex E subunit
MLGLCPLLATTTTATNGLGMGLATTTVLVLSNATISLIRNLVRPEVRLPVFVLVIASFVTAVELTMQAVFYELYLVLGLFIPLIVTNCAIIGRAEAFASKTRLDRAIVDGLAMGLGFTLVLMVLGGIREFLGQGTLFYQAASAARRGRPRLRPRPGRELPGRAARHPAARRLHRTWPADRAEEHHRQARRVTETSSSGLSDVQYWLLIGIGVVALMLVTLNIVTALSNADLREEVRARQQYISESVQLGQFNKQFVQGLATLSAQSGDDDLRAVLAKHGIDFTVKPRDAAAQEVSQ